MEEDETSGMGELGEKCVNLVEWVEKVRKHG